MTQTLNITTARSQLSQLVKAVFNRDARVIIEKSGIPVAGLVSAADLARLEQLERQREEDFAVLDEVRDTFSDVPEEELEREIARAVRQARGKLWRERKQAHAPDAT